MKILAVNIWAKEGPKEKRKQSAVDWWRIKNPYRVLKGKGWDITFADHFVKDESAWGRLGETYDTIITSYISHPKTVAYLKALSEHPVYRIKHIMDFDDNPFEVDEMNPVYLRYGPGTQERENLLYSLSLASYITVSTPHLAKVLQPLTPAKIFLAPNAIDDTLYTYKKAPDNKDRVVIGYQGSSTHQNDLYKTGFIWALRRILRTYPQVDFAIAGGVLDSLEHYMPKERIRYIEGSPDFYKWIKVWGKLPFDIGVAPLQATTFNKSKSAIKYYEYALRRIPGVYSFWDPYLPAVHEHHTGYLAQDEDEWYEKLKWLIESPDLRTRIANEAFEDVTKFHTIKDTYTVWEQILNQL